MPIKQRIPGEAHQYEYLPGNIKVEDYDKKNAENNSYPKLNNAAGLKQYAEDLSKNSDKNVSSNDIKYAIATRTAQDRLNGVEGVDKKRLKQEIDDIYEKELGATTTGREMRGENSFTDLIGGLKDFTDGLNTAIGNGIDGIWDWGAGWIGDQFGIGDQVRGFLDGEDLALVPDIIEDIATAAIPYVGVPLVMAKNAVQQSDNLSSAISGKDIVTLEDLEGTQQAGRALEGLGAIGLSALGGVGKIANVGKHAKALNEGAKTIVKDALKSGEKISLNEANKMSSDVLYKAIQETPQAFDSSVIKAASNTNDLLGVPENQFLRRMNQFKKGREASRDLWRGDIKEANKIRGKLDRAKSHLDAAEMSGETKRAEKISDTIKQHEAALKQAGRHPIDAFRALRIGMRDPANLPKNVEIADMIKSMSRSGKKEAKAAEKLKRKNMAKFERAFNTVAPRLQKTGATLATMAPMILASEMADTGGESLEELAANWSSKLAADPGKALMTALPLGTYKAGRKLPGPTGKYNGRWGQPLMRSAGYANNLTEDYSYIPDSYNEDELFERLRLAKDKYDNELSD